MNPRGVEFVKHKSINTIPESVICDLETHDPETHGLEPHHPETKRSL